MLLCRWCLWNRIQPCGLPCKHYKLQLQIHLLAPTQEKKQTICYLNKSFNISFSLLLYKIHRTVLNTFHFHSFNRCGLNIEHANKFFFFVFSHLSSNHWKWVTDTSLSTTIFNKEKFLIFNFGRVVRKWSMKGEKKEIRNIKQKSTPQEHETEKL